MPELYIITGSNGAGKSTIGPNYLPTHIQDSCIVFDGDKLFIEKRNELWQTIKAPKEVKKLAYDYTVEVFEEQVNAALRNKTDYVYEGHFTNDATWDVPRRFKAAGYSVNLIFFGLKNPDISQMRVIERANEGGHWVDRRTIEDNYYGNLEKVQQHMDAVDNIYFIDTTEQHIVLAHIQNDEVIFSLPLEKLPDWFVRFLPLLIDKIKKSGK